MAEFTQQENYDLINSSIQSDRPLCLPDDDLSYADLRGAKYDAKTAWPKGFGLLAAEAVFLEDED